jgi:Methyltransferase domain
MAENSGLDAYIPRMSEIHGGFHHPDPQVFRAICEAQTEHGITGDILEIGSYLGRSAIVLGFLIDGEERLHICEPFPNPTAVNPDFLPHTVGWYHPYTQELFEENYLRFHEDLPEIYAYSSLDLPGKLASDSFRFVHLDGSHTPEALQNDIGLAKDILNEDGVMSFSLYRGMESLEVAAAAWAEVAKSEVFPMVATETHLYASLKPYGPEQTADLHTRLRTTRGIEVVPSMFRGVDVALMQPKPGHEKAKAWIPPALLPTAKKVQAWLQGAGR